MRYGVNFYRERVARGARVRRGLLRGAGLGLVVGIEVVLLVGLVISGFEFRSQARSMRREVATLESQSRPYRESPALPAARALMQARLARTDWTPVLVAVAETTPRNVVLTRVQGGVGKGRGELRGLDIEGRLLGRTRDLSAVIAYMDSLRANPVMRERFPRIDLGKAKGGTGRNFRIVCRPASSGKES